MAESVSDKPNLSGELLRLLIVEDQPANAELCLRELKKAGFDVRSDVVSTAEEFIARLQAEEYDIILADHGLQGWSGLEALQSLRDLQKGIPFILVTGQLDDEIMTGLFLAGITDYVLKDDMARLPIAVRQALAEKKLREKNRNIEATRSPALRILYVEDNKTDAELSLILLKKAGYEFTADIVDTREEFTARLAANTYDIIISDQNLPTWTGIDVLEQARALGFDIPLILVTGSLEDDVAAQFAKRGVTDYLLKDRMARLPLVLRRTLEHKALREQDKHSQANYRSLVERAPYGIFQAGMDGKLLMVNPALVEMLGYQNPEEILSVNLFADINQEQESAWVERCRKGEPIDGVEALWKRKDGTPLTVQLSSRPVRGTDGAAAHFDLIAENITERKRAEEALIKLRKAVDTSGEVIFMTDREGVITFINPEFTRLYGYTAQEVVGKKTPRILKSGSKSPEEYASFWEAILDKRVAKEEWVNKTKDGRLVTIENSGNPILDDYGGITGFLAIQRDITERKRADENLIASEVRYRRLFESARDGVLILEAGTGEILDVNPFMLELLGYSRQEFLGRQLWEIGPFQDKRNSQTSFRVLQENEYIRYDDLPLETKSGKKVEVEFVSNAYFSGRRKVIQCNIRDITERKQLEQQLRQAQKMEAVGQLAGGIAHDFNNLLTIIMGYSQLLLDRLRSDDPMRAHVNEIKNAGEMAAQLTRQLLAFSRRQALAPQVLDLKTVMAKVEQMLRRMIGEDVVLDVVPGPGVGPVKADPWQIEQVLLNLAVNARDAMPQGGKITMEVADIELDEAFTQSHVGSTPGPFVVLTVSDSGCGMDQATKAHIFEPFFTTKEKGKGTGLGLAMVYGIVKQSGGYIVVQSEPGKGATFKIYLPRINEPVEVDEPRKARVKPERGCETVLLVEDEPGLRELARTILEMSGYTVLEASGGNEALLKCKTHKGPIHLMVTDVVMPEMNGRELAKRLASLDRKMKVLYMSGYTGDAIVKRGALEPGVAFLQKPFEPDALINKVREVLDHSTLR